MLLWIFKVVISFFASCVQILAIWLLIINLDFLHRSNDLFATSHLDGQMTDEMSESNLVFARINFFWTIVDYMFPIHFKLFSFFELKFENNIYHKIINTITCCVSSMIHIILLKKLLLWYNNESSIINVFKAFLKKLHLGKHIKNTYVYNW